MADAAALDLPWRKSRRCESSQCLEVAATVAGAAVRNNSRPDTHLRVDRDSWRELLVGVRSGHFDRR